VCKTNKTNNQPVDKTADKIRALFDLTRRHDVDLCCGFQRRFDPSYLSLYHQINTAKSIGAPPTSSIFFGDHPMPS
jgi:myo-inositol 2-dehydrogenase/D-chiro-inositol 1-dehydrogenase